ncbi:MAG: GIY-YIG nuclease family protein [Bacteroidia bacterium]|nr:GIY-YIG nuclease family protein [Bacteroidia bacterium]
MYFVYIIKSESIDKFYVGETNDLEIRLKQHNNGEFDFSFTKQANDWMIYFKMECPDRSIARKIELHIKNMKSRKYFESLSKYPEMTQKLLDKYIK